MKIFLIILAVILLAILLVGYLFVQWANKPENVAAVQKARQEEEIKRIAEEKRKIELVKEIEAKKANLKLVIDENFANNRFEFLDYKLTPKSPFKFEKNQFEYSVASTRGLIPTNYFIFSKEDFGDFAAEIDFTIHGYDARTGIFWDAQPNGDQNPTEYSSAYSGASGLDVEVRDQGESYNLGNFFESITTQKLRVERFSENLKVSINGKVLFDKNLKNIKQGKIGVFLRNQGRNKDRSESISIEIKSFKAWK